MTIPCPELGPIGVEEMPVSQLIHEVHSNACIPTAHHPRCNTLRRLVEDWKGLLAMERAR